MGDVEAWELIEPLLYLGRSIRPNTGGPGKFRPVQVATYQSPLTPL